MEALTKKEDNVWAFGEEPAGSESGQPSSIEGASKDAASKQAASEQAAAEEIIASSPEARGWRIAANMVNRFRPVPHLMWPIIYAVYGRAGEIGRPDPNFFSSVSALIMRAASDRTLVQDATLDPHRNLAEAISRLGPDVAAASCLVHSICRRISTAVAERVSRPILDDALLRTHIGYYVGLLSPSMGAGRGMIAGFAGRCGLAVQIAAGDSEQAQRALTGMATGQDMGLVCNNVYGCDPLEVAAMSLIAGGCCREIAFGISSYIAPGRETTPGSEQYRWLALFSVIESMRMAQADAISEEYWQALGYDAKKRTQLQEHITTSQHRGHGWNWITQPQLVSGDEAATEPKKFRGRKENPSPQ